MAKRVNRRSVYKERKKDKKKNDEIEKKIKESSTTNYNDILHQLKRLLELWGLATDIKPEICVKSNENTAGNISLGIQPDASHR